MGFDNSFVVMNEEEMHDVNGGGKIKISISNHVISTAATAMMTGGTAAVYALFAKQIALTVVIWLTCSTALGPIGIGVVSVFASGAVGALLGVIVHGATQYLAGKIGDVNMTIAKGWFIPNYTLRFG